MKKPLWKRPKYSGTPYQMFFRKVASGITSLLLPTNITANQVTFVALILTIVPACLFYMENVWLNLLGIVVLYFINILDKVDGQLARAKKITSKRGPFIDGMLHLFTIVAIFFPVGLRIYYKGSFDAFLAAIGCIIFVLISSYNHLNRTYLLGAAVGDERNKLQISEGVRKQKLLITLFSIPNQNLPEILAVCFIFPVLLPWFLYAYLLYFAFSFFAYAVVLSRFPGE